MIKLVFFRISKGNFDSGFDVFVRMQELGSTDIQPEFDGYLPPNPKIPELYYRWQADYSRLGKRFRGQVGELLDIKELQKRCHQVSQEFIHEIKQWLELSNDIEFQKMREKLNRYLGVKTNDEVRVFIQTENELLKKLPWHEWDLFSEIYTKAETVLSPLEVKPGKPPAAKNKQQVRILGILGNSEGIDLTEDTKSLNHLPDADVSFLNQPTRSQLTDMLWGEDWDILFFAGHSNSDGNSGNISINSEETLNLSDLKNGLRKVIKGGLQLAIFNSCDGLQLAKVLLDLDVPQTIVMREQVPDKVAQEFLKYFLSDFSKGKSVYLAVRAARERLHDKHLDADFPGAAWLPVIYQNPGWNPLTWQEFVFSPGTWQLFWCQHLTTNNPINNISWLGDFANDFINTSRDTLEMEIKVAFSSDGKYFTHTGEQKLKLYQLNGESVAIGNDISPFWEFDRFFTAVAIAPNGRLIAGVRNNEIKISRQDNGQLLHTLSKTANSDSDRFCLDAVAFSPDGQILVINDDNNITIWDTNTGQRLHQLSGHTDLVTSLAFSQNGKILISGSHDRTIRCWNVQTRKNLGTLGSHDRGVYTVAFSPDGQYVASGGQDNKIRLWSLDRKRDRSEESDKIITGHSKAVFSIAFSPDSKILASGSADGTIKMWSVSTGKVIETLPEQHHRGVASVAFSPDGRHFASGDRDMTVRIWQRE